MKESLGIHTSIAEMIKERTDQRIFLEALQVSASSNRPKFLL